MAGRTLRLYITADGRAAVRAFDEVGSASSRTADKVEKSGRRQEEAFGRVEESTHRLRNGIATVAGTVGFAGLAFGLGDVVKAGQKWQVQQAQLQNALKNTGQYSKQTMASIQAAAEKLATHGGYSVPEQLSGINQFIRLTGSASKAIQLNEAATNLSRGTNLGFAQAQRMVGQVLTGNTGRLQKYLGIIQPVKTAEFALAQAHGFNLVKLQEESLAYGKLGASWLKGQEVLHNLTPAMMQHAQLLDKQATAQKALAIIQDKYGGNAAAFSRTTSGAISNAENQLDIAIEKIGQDLLPIVASMARGFVSIAQSVSKNWPAMKRDIADVVDFVKKNKDVFLALGIGAATVLIYSLGAAAIAAVPEIIAMVAAMAPIIAIPAAIALVVAGFAYLYLKVKAFRDIVNAVIPYIEMLFGRMINGIVTEFQGVVQIFKGVWEVIKGLFTLNAGEVWKGVKDIFGGAINTIKGWILTISAPFRTAFNAVEKYAKGPIDWLINKIKWIIDKVTWLPREIAKLDPFSGGGLSARNQRGVAAAGGYRGHALHRQHGGLIPHMADGGLLGGYGGGDSILALLEAGEGVLRKESVQAIGTQQFNALNVTGSVAGVPQSMPDEVYVAVPIRLQAGARVIADLTAHTAAKRAALSGHGVPG